jgi:hypothetical protein
MIQVIAEHPEVVILEDESGKFLFTRDNQDIVALPDLPIINHHLGNNGAYRIHHEVQSMLS